MAFQVIPDTDIDVDSPGKTTSVFGKLRDNLRAMRHAVWAWVFAEQSTSASTPGVKLTQKEVYVPSLADYSGIARSFTVRFKAKTTASGTGYYYLKDNASSTTGSVVNTTATTYEDKTATLTIDTSWKGTRRIVELWAYGDGSSTAYAKSEDAVICEMVY